MRYPLLVLLGSSTVLLLACSDSTGPSAEPMLIRVTVDWPMVREATFHDAVLNIVGFDCPIGSSTGCTRLSYAFQTNGTAEASFTAQCTQGQFLVGTSVTLAGRYEHAENDCSGVLAPNPFGFSYPDWLRCTEEVQNYVVERPAGPDCQAPPAQ